MPKDPRIPESVTTLGDAVRYLREQRGMTLRELAEKVGVSAPFLSDLEHNRRSTDRLDAVAAALGVSTEMLQAFDARLGPELRDWISQSPGMTGLLRELKESGLSAGELRAAFRRTKR